PVVVRMPDGVEKAIGGVMVNEFRDTTFGPYNEVIFSVTAVPKHAQASLKCVQYINGFSLQTPVDRGATLYLLKLWLDQLSPIDGGNDFLGTNKELGAFVFTDHASGTREFQAVDKEGQWLVRGRIPSTSAPGEGLAARSAYHDASIAAGSEVPAGTLAVVPVASRPDHALGRPATPWAFAIDWRRPVMREVLPAEVALRLGEGEWGQRFGNLGFTPMLTAYGPQCVGQIYQNMADCPFVGPTRAAR
ncbi:MAG TPA: acetoacetate decarboxylase family protein, partial [Polyangiaceae bacterium]